MGFAVRIRGSKKGETSECIFPQISAPRTIETIVWSEKGCGLWLCKNGTDFLYHHEYDVEGVERVWCFYFARGSSCEYCNEYVCVSVLVSVYLSVCLSVCLSVREDISVTAPTYMSLPIFCAYCQWPWLGPSPAGWRNPKGKGQFWGFLPHW